MSDSELEPGEYKQNSSNHNSKAMNTPPSKHESRSPASRHSGSPTRSYSRSRSRSKQSRGTPRSRSRSYKRSRSKSRDGYRYGGSPSKHGRRSRSYDRDRRHKRRHSYSRSRSRSRSISPMSGRKRHIGDRMNPPTGRCLGVFGLSLYTTENDLRDVFSKYGYIEKANIVIDQKTGRSRGFGFVYYDNTEDAVDAKDRANGMELDGRRIRVDFSITKRAHTPTPGMYVGQPTPHYGPPRHSRYEGRGHGDRDRYDRGGGRYERDRGGHYDDYRERDRDRYRRSPSPYYRRRSPSPYGRDRRY